MTGIYAYTHPPAEIFDGRDWYPVVSKPGQEERAAKHLDEQGYAVFLPQCRVLRSHAGKSEVVTKPLYPRYLFIGCDPDTFKPLRSVENTPGVAFVMRSAAHAPVMVRPGVLRAIWRRLDADGGSVNFVPPDKAALLADKLARFPQGTPVRITAGPFAGFQGIFDRGEAERVRVLVGIFGGQSPADMPWEAIEAA